MSQASRRYGSPAEGPPSVLVFDVNETLLDIEALEPQFEDIFGDATLLRTWFDQLVMYSMTLTLSGFYVDFFHLGQAVLNMLSQIHRVDPSADQQHELILAMRTMPAHPDAAPGLQSLLAAGYRLVTLTNSPHQAGSPSPLDNAGLSQYFEQQVSVDSSGVYKPSTHLYRRVAANLGVPVSDCMMVAAHAWDIIGAQGAGMRGALITRPGNAALPAYENPQPTVVAADITRLAVTMRSIEWAVDP